MNANCVKGIQKASELSSIKDKDRVKLGEINTVYTWRLLHITDLKVWLKLGGGDVHHQQQQFKVPYMMD